MSFNINGQRVIERDGQVCMQCGDPGHRHEVLNNAGGDTREQLWIYCETCDVETFYDLPDERP